ncbi:hypothetical protein [Paenibacillus sp. P3E]|uniref:hypothetical protein n=1 Tax=Paenibacillus sp. P3E TaxID=1349435 RepID=UPI0011613F81|nr:hypothetical protein [Paenibacillus sp. P3E]
MTQLQAAEGELVAGNIRNGVNVFGVTGNLTPRMYAEGFQTTDGNGGLWVTGLTFKPSIVYLDLFDVPSQSTYVYFSSDNAQWTWVRYAGTNPSGNIQGTGTVTSPNAWGNGGFNISTGIAGRSAFWRAWR